MGLKRIRAVGGPLRGIGFALADRTVLGRSGDVQVQLLSRGVSRHHAVITLESDHLVLRDLTSSNGTFVNGERISQRALRPGDVVKIDSHEFVYEEIDKDQTDDAGDMLTVLSGPAEEITRMRDDIPRELASLRTTWRPGGEQS